MLISLLAVGVLSSGSRRPLGLVQHYGDARDDRHPGSVPQPTCAQETRARYGRRTATRALENLRSGCRHGGEWLQVAGCCVQYSYEGELQSCHIALKLSGELSSIGDLAVADATPGHTPSLVH